MLSPAKYGQIDHGTFVRVPVGNTTVDLLRDDRIASSIIGGKPFEPNTLDFFGKSISPGTRVFDIGCYSGLFAIAAARLGAIPIGFEPLPDNFAQVGRNMMLNKQPFNLEPFALSDKEGKAQLKYNPAVRLTSGASLERKSGPSIEIQTRRLDDYVREFHFQDMRISMIKMDVERHEPSVIRGGMLTISTHKPVMIIEANDLKMREEVVHLMTELGYPEPRTADERNLLFVPA